LFYGPPGCGKTSIAEAIARETQSRFVRINAVMSNVAELREILAAARRRPEAATILFIDELHRFNKSQQDLLLPDVEEGNVRLIGATTHNPGFYVNPPLLSRSHLFRLEPLATAAVAGVLRQALTDAERGLGARGVTADDKLLADLAVFCDGDLRRALNALEVLVLGPAGKRADHARRPRGVRPRAADPLRCRRGRALRHDLGLHQKLPRQRSGRGPVLAGQDARRRGGPAVHRAAARHPGERGRRPGRPAGPAAHRRRAPRVRLHRPARGELTLAHATLYIATAPKSNSATLALGEAHRVLKEQPVQPVPLPLRDKSGAASKQNNHGKGYRYSHDYPENISGQDYLQKPVTLYTPKTAGWEAKIADRLARWQDLKAALKAAR
jgi:putative ATPase